VPQEDDRGAAWEIEITATTAARSTCTSPPTAPSSRGSASSARHRPSRAGRAAERWNLSHSEPEQAALDALGEGTTTWVEREDGRGVAWEIEVTLSDGREIDVLIGPDGSVIA
jgi:hypothetical protein